LKGKGKVEKTPHRRLSRQEMKGRTILQKTVTRSRNLEKKRRIKREGRGIFVGAEGGSIEVWV